MDKSTTEDPFSLKQEFRRNKQSFGFRMSITCLDKTEAIRMCNASRIKYPGMHEIIPSESWNPTDRGDDPTPMSDEIVKDL